MALSREVIETDHQLEEIADRAGGQLARHRWHWTLDVANGDRVSIREYARQVGRDHMAISRMANGHAAWLTSGDDSSPPQKFIERAGMTAETEAAAEAVAKARNITVGSARTGGRGVETRRVRDIARQRAEERGTSVEEEAPKVAEIIVRHENAERAKAEEEAEHTDIRFVEMEGYLVKAKRELLKALKIAPNVPWDDESRELLTETVGNVKALLALIDTALSGVSGVDWDAEWVKVAGDEIR